MPHSTLRRAAVAVAAASGLLAAAPVAVAAPTLDVSASTGLAAGQAVTVDLRGLEPDLAGVAVGQCKPQVVAPTDCHLAGALMGGADAQGVWQPRGGARTLTLVAAVGGVDCAAAPGACTVSVTSLTNPSQILASVPLSFGTPAPAQPTPAEAPATAAEESDSDTNVVVWIVGAVVVLAVLAGIAVVVRRRGRA